MTDYERFNPAVNPDAQEALSLKYGNNILMLLPLRSGRVALFDAARDLQEIFDPVAGIYIEDLRQWSTDFYTRLFHQSKNASAGRFFGEPDDKTLKKDIIASRKSERKPKPGDDLSLAIDIVL